MSKLPSFIMLLSIFLFLRVTAQNNYEQLLKVVPPSPTVASLGKYGDVPIGLYTGVPNISIPLYEIRDGSLDLPISLSYHAGGIKVEEIASPVGLSWSLNAGGVLGRNVRGLPDEIFGWQQDSANTVENIMLSGNPNKIEQLAVDVDRGNRDGEADIYYYNFNQFSGKFFYDQKGVVHTLPAKNILINNIGNAWKITAEDGTVYMFDKAEQVNSVNCSIADQSVYSAWFLSSIKSVDGKRQITFDYDKVSYTYETLIGQIKYFASDGSGSLCMQNRSPCLGTQNYNTHRLARINFGEGYVKFSYNTVRYDLMMDKSLDEMEVYNNNNTLIKRIRFGYSYFGNNDDGYNLLTQNSKRLKLISITEEDTINHKPPYIFEYNEAIKLPGRLSYSQDHWGYYNGKTNEDLIAAFTTTLTSGQLVTFAGADRNANPETAQAGILTKITYPTGGETLFTYESNTVTDNSVESQMINTKPVGGLRINQIEDKPGNGGQSMVKNYKYYEENDSTHSSGVLVNFPDYGYDLFVSSYKTDDRGNPMGPGNFCSYRVRQSFSNYPLATTQGSYVGYRHVIVDLGENGESSYSYNAYSDLITQSFPFPPVEDFDWTRGFLLSSKDFIRRNGKLILAKETVNTPTSFNQLKMYGIKTGKSENELINGEMVPGVQPLPKYTFYPTMTEFYTLGQTKERIYDQNDTTRFIENLSDFTYSPQHLQLIQSKSVTSKSDDSSTEEIISNKKYSFDYSFTGVPFGSEARGIKNLQDLHAVNAVIEQYVIKQNRDRVTNELHNRRVVNGGITRYKIDKPYAEQLLRLETGSSILLVNFGDGSLLDNNSFIKNANAVINDSYKAAILFNSYDSIGNITSQQKATDVKRSYIWGYNSRYPVAEVVGADYETILATSNLNLQVLQSFSTSDEDMRIELNKIRTNFPAALVTTYTYKPLVGISSQTDINNKTSYYEYDSFGGLLVIRDQDKNILKKFCYNYKGQQGNCYVSVVPQWVSTGNYRCVQNGNGENTGAQQREEKDINTSSITYNQMQWVDNGVNNISCPIPSGCGNNCYVQEGHSCVNGQCESGYRVYTDSYYDNMLSLYVCTYHYEFSDGSWSQNYTENNDKSCSLNQDH